MTLDPATVSAAHAQAERDRQPHAVASRTFTGPDLAQVRASNARMRAECHDLIDTLTDGEDLRAVIHHIADLDCDVVNQAINETGAGS